MKPVAVYVERGARKTFASAIQWPGWSRGGRSEADALESLLEHGPRYGAAISPLRLDFTVPRAVDGFEVVEHVKGGSGTDFGVPGEPARTDHEPLAHDELDRQTHLLQQIWSFFDSVAERAVGAELRKGPRGGGRDLDRIRGHVFEADAAYVRQLGARADKSDLGDLDGAFRDLRALAITALVARARDEPVPNASAVRRPWLPRYYVRRSAWHALDHAWEIEDRSAEPENEGAA